jgi:predicted transcriptional regulator
MEARKMGATLELTLPEEITFELERIAQLKKEPKERIVLFAISFYIERLSEMKDEINAWDKASDEALSNFERNL